MNILLKLSVCVTVLSLKAMFVFAQQSLTIPVIPYPTSAVPKTGIFVVNKNTRIIADKGFEREAKYLEAFLQQAGAFTINEAKSGASNTISLVKNSAIGNVEGYDLSISSSSIKLEAADPKGIFHGIITLQQLFPPATASKRVQNKMANLPAMLIRDEPQYAWRGIHLDVARHFFSIDYLKKLADAMAFYKMNKLHLHLTDDQGWRIEIKKYPKLTSEGAWRTFNNQDSACIRQSVNNPDMAIDKSHVILKDGKELYGGFYTRQQMKDFVAYAAERHIDVIPEIDMPGHMMAAIHAYPYLSCEGGSKWGELFSTPICPCKESTYEFSENIFSEIMEIFPSEYIHLGADEVDRKTWEASPACQELMKKENLKDLAELQSYFVKRMERFFQSRGRKLIGWDEILEGGVDPTAYVMYWRGWKPNAPIEAAKNGNHVIMTPGNPLYFDSPPDANSLENIYTFNVAPLKLTADEAKFIIGAQANLWSELVPSENRADYLYFPRLLALAERVWSKHLNYASFSGRLKQQYARLNEMKIHYRLPDITGIVEQNVFTDKAVLNVQPPLPGLTVHYTMDGTLPAPSSPTLLQPLIITDAVTIKLAAFGPAGGRGEVYTLNYKKDTFASPVNPSILKKGLAVSYYKKFYRSSALLAMDKADSTFISEDFIVPASVNAPSFGLSYNGFIEVPETGIYTFYLTCDDGGILNIANKQVINNDGLHPPAEKSGQKALQKGLHPFQLNFIEGGGGFTLRLKYGKGNEAPKPIPAAWLRHE